MSRDGCGSHHGRPNRRQVERLQGSTALKGDCPTNYEKCILVHQPPTFAPRSTAATASETSFSSRRPPVGPPEGVNVGLVSVVHVVQKFVVYAPRKTHKPLIFTVNSGQPRSMKTAMMLRVLAKWQVTKTATFFLPR
jgi:hypothetical protein